MPFEDFPTTLPEFDRRYGDEVACWNHLPELKWPDGFRCRAAGCSGRRSYFVIERGVDECATCGRQTSVTAGTMFHRTRTPLKLWFRAIFKFVSRKHGCTHPILVGAKRKWPFHQRPPCRAAEDAVKTRETYPFALRIGYSTPMRIEVSCRFSPMKIMTLP